MTPDSENIIARLRALKPILQREMGITRLHISAFTQNDTIDDLQ